MLLETERLTIRTLTIDDADLLLAVWTDPAFMRNVADRGVRTLDEARTAMEKGAFHLYEEYGYGPYRVARKSDDCPIGICGIFRREGLDEPDIGYALLPDHYSNGYMIEAASCVLAYARDVLAIPYLTAVVQPGNGPSVRLLEKLGLEFERMMRLPGDDTDLALYGIRFEQK